MPLANEALRAAGPSAVRETPALAVPPSVGRPAPSGGAAQEEPASPPSSVPLAGQSPVEWAPRGPVALMKP
jgi:hypothetical protein